MANIFNYLAKLFHPGVEWKFYYFQISTQFQTCFSFQVKNQQLKVENQVKGLKIKVLTWGMQQKGPQPLVPEMNEN